MHSLDQNVFHLTFNLQLLPASVLIFDIHDCPNHSGALKKTRILFKTVILIFFELKYETLWTHLVNSNDEHKRRSTLFSLKYLHIKKKSDK